MSLVIGIIVNALVVLVLSYVLPGVSVDSFLTAILVVIVFGLVNAFIKPVVKLLTLPLNIVTLGIFGFVLNVLFVLLVDALVSGFTVDGFLWAAIFGLVLSLVTGLLGTREA